MNEELKHLVGRLFQVRGQTRRIELIYDDVEGGLRLEEPAHGFYSWNIKDGEVLPPEKPTPATPPTEP